MPSSPFNAGSSMSRLFLAISFAATAPFSGGLSTFTAGSPAKADDVNRNFAYLDSAKASVSSVDVLTSAVSAKAEKSALAGKADNSRADSLAKALLSKADSSVWKAVRDSSSKLRDAINKPGLWIWDPPTGLVSGWVNTLPGSNVTGIQKTGGSGDIGALALQLRDTSGQSVIDLQTDGFVNSWGSLSGIQTNSVTRIDANGNAFLNWGGFGTNQVSPLGASLTVQAVHNRMEGWDEGIEILPATNGKWGCLFYRNPDDPTKISGSLVLARHPDGGLVVAINGLTGMVNTGSVDRPFTIDAAGSAFFGSSVKIGGTVYAQDARVTDLRVAGTLKTSPTEPWADYVFEPGYKAMPLREVESFAKANGHLPEVPSATEVQKDGIDLAKMNAILLKKIEELTLHAAEQERKMEAMQTEIREMKASR